jgi:uncharacterized protein YeaO (DUF488 family)
MNKGKAGIDIWLKEVAPSDELRKWFKHGLKNGVILERDILPITP